MKKIFFILLAAVALVQLPATNAKAQAGISYTTLLDTLTNTDTTASSLSFTKIGSNVKGIQITAKKISGTPSATVYFQVRINDNDWYSADSLVVTNVATVQQKWIQPTSTYFKDCRLYSTTSGTQSVALTFSYLRRQDEY